MFKYIFPFVLAIVGLLGLAFIFGTFNINEWDQLARGFFFYAWLVISGIVFGVEVSEGR